MTVAEDEGDFGLDPIALARAEAALAAMGDSYLVAADQAAGHMADLLAAALADPEGRAVHLHQLHRLAHDVKGQAATFGYPLVTEIARLLSRRLAAVSDPDTAELDRIARHVAALRRAIAERITGDGGEAGMLLLAQLEQ